MQKQVILAISAIVLLSPLNVLADTTNLLTNPGAEDGSITGWVVGGNSNPSVDSGTFDFGINPHTGSFDFYGHTGAFGTLSQTVLLIGAQGITAAEIDAGDLFASISFWEQGLNQGSVSDHGQITLTFLSAGNTSLGSASSNTVDSHNGTWQQDSETFAIPVGTQSIDYTMNFIRSVGSDNDAFIDDNSLVISSATPPSTAPEPSYTLMLGLGFCFGAFALYRSARIRSSRRG